MRMPVLLLLFCLSPVVMAASSPQFINIFPPQGEHTHGSSIIQCPDGSFLACWFQGSGERTANDVRILGSRLKKGASQWSPVFLMADTPDLPDCNPVLYLDRHERVWMFWIAVRANRWEYSLLKYKWAKNPHGSQAPAWDWQDAIILKPGDEFPRQLAAGFEALDYDEGMWAEYAPPYHRLLIDAAEDPAKRQMGWMTRIHPITLDDGRMLLPLYSDGFNVSLVAISDDDGKTWRASAPMVGLGPIQPTLVQRDDGTLVAYLRDSGDVPNRVMVSSSEDKGETWSPATDTELPNPGSSLEAIELDSGNWLMILNDTEEGRHRLSAFLSDDEGVTWKWRRILEPGSMGGSSFSYPSVIETQDGAVHMTYSARTDQGSCIRYAVITEAWIKSGD